MKKALIIAATFLVLLAVVYAHFGTGDGSINRGKSEVQEQQIKGMQGFHEKIGETVKSNDFKAFQSLLEQYNMPMMQFVDSEQDFQKFRKVFKEMDEMHDKMHESDSFQGMDCMMHGKSGTPEGSESSSMHGMMG